MADVFDRETEVVVGDLDVSRLHCEFSIVKDMERDPNQSAVTIYNLTESNRARLAQYDADKGPDRVIPVRVSAGYRSEGGASDIFLGNMRRTISQKTGPTWVTQVLSGDGETKLRIARINRKFALGSTPYDVVSGLLVALGLGRGNLDDVRSKLSNGGEESFTLKGPVGYHLDNWTKPFGITWSIQGNRPHFELTRQEGAPVQVVRLTPETGLIGSPSIESNGDVNCTAQIRPGLDIGEVFSLESDTVSGSFRIRRIAFMGSTRGGRYECKITGNPY